MKKTLISLLVFSIFAFGCTQGNLEAEPTEPEEAPVSSIFDEIGVDFEYPEVWGESTLRTSDTNVFIYHMLSEDVLGQYDENEYYPIYDWAINIGEDTFTGEGAEDYFTYKLFGPVYDLDEIVSVINERGLEEYSTQILSDEMLGENRVVSMSVGGICGSLYAYISDGENTVLYSATCVLPSGQEKELETLRDIAETLVFTD